MKKLKIGIVGTRGIPAKYGGFETFAQELCTRLVRNGIQCVVYADRDSYFENTFEGVDIVFLKVTKSENPLRYYYESLKSAIKTCDIIYVTGTGGAIFYPILKRGKKKIITNTDGIEYARDKWSFLKKIFIRLTEYFAVHYSDIIIADSLGIKNYLLKKYKINSEKIWQIEYGAYINNHKDENVLKEYNILDNDYYLIISRLEPENNIQMMIDGYIKCKSKKPLIIVGNININNKYISNLLTAKCDNIRFIGGIYDPQKLRALRTTCFAHIHGHSVGGTNPSLLEALGSGNVILAHDNIYNKQVGGEDIFYFKNSNELCSVIKKNELMNDNARNIIADNVRNRIINYYNWESITKRYIDNFKIII